MCSEVFKSVAKTSDKKYFARKVKSELSLKLLSPSPSTVLDGPALEKIKDCGIKTFHNDN